MAETKEKIIMPQIEPFLTEALITNEKTYYLINKLYQEYKFMFYKIACEDKYFNHPFFGTKNLVQEESANKALGIIRYISINELRESSQRDENYEKINESFQNILKTGFKFTYNYLLGHSSVNVEELTGKLINKNQGLTNISFDLISSNFSVMMYLAKKYNKVITSSHKTILKFIRGCNEKLKLYDDIKDNPINGSELRFLNGQPLPNEMKVSVDTLKKELFKKYGKIKTIDSILKDHKNTLAIKMTMVFEIYQTTIYSMFNGIEIANKDIEAVLVWYLLYLEFIGKLDKDNLSIETEYFDSIFFLGICNIMFVKLFKNTKEYYFKNNRETLFVELEESQMKYDKLSTELETERKNHDNDKKDYEGIISKLERDIKRLENSSNELEINKKELTGLRNYIFGLDNEEATDTDMQYLNESEIDYDKLENVKCIIIGGHIKWQEKIRETMKNSVLISVDTLGFDIKILEGKDHIFIKTTTLSHALYEKVMGAIKKWDKNIVYLPTTNNIEISLRFILKYIK